MNGIQTNQSPARSARRPHPTALGADRLQRLAVPQRKRPACVYRAFAPLAQHEQRRSIVAAVGGQAAWHQEPDDFGQEPTCLGRGWPAGSVQKGRLHEGWPAPANPVSTHGYTSLCDSDEVRRTVQGNQRLEVDRDTRHGEGGNSEGRNSREERCCEIENPSPKIGRDQSRSWGGRAKNQSKKWTMARSTPPKIGLGEKLQLVRKANSGAGFSALTDLSVLTNHSPNIGLLSTVAIHTGNFRLREDQESLSVAGERSRQTACCDGPLDPPRSTAVAAAADLGMEETP